MNIVTVLALEVIVCSIIVVVRERKDHQTNVWFYFAMAFMALIALHFEAKILNWMPKHSEVYLCYALMIAGGICALVGGLRTRSRVLGALIIAAAATVALCGMPGDFIQLSGIPRG